MTLLNSWLDACRAKDIDRLMSLYADDIVYYDVVPPLQFAGAEEVRRNFLRFFDQYDGPIGLEIHDLNVVAKADLAFAHMLAINSGSRTSGPADAVHVRATVCCRRSAGQWLIAHEHISIPATVPGSGAAG
jgi:uncharacterized protein (TIGR02246 family)